MLDWHGGQQLKGAACCSGLGLVFRICYFRCCYHHCYYLYYVVIVLVISYRSVCMDPAKSSCLRFEHVFGAALSCFHLDPNMRTTLLGLGWSRYGPSGHAKHGMVCFSIASVHLLQSAQDPLLHSKSLAAQTFCFDPPTSTIFLTR